MPLEYYEQAGAEGRSVNNSAYVQSLCEARDEGGFIDLLRSMEPEAQSYVRRYIGDGHGASDVLQMAYMNALRGFRTQTYDPTRPLRPWYYSVLTRAALDFQRREKKFVHTFHFGAYEMTRNGETSEELAGIDLLSDDYDPTVQIQLDECHDILRSEIIRLLSPEQCDLMRRFYGRQQKYREIAEELGVPLGTVKSRLFHIINILRDQSCKRLVNAA